MPEITRTQLAGIIVNMLEAGASPNKVAKQIAAYLIEQRRTRELDDLMRDVEKLRAQNGVLEARATSKYTLSPSVKRDLSALLKTHHDGIKTVVIDEQIDEDVIGGVLVETTSTQLDLTIANKLNQLKMASQAQRSN